MASRVRTVQAIVNRLGKGPEMPAVLAATAPLALAVLAGLFGWDLLAAILVIASIGGEWFLERKSPTAALLFDQAAFGMPMRFVLRVVTVFVAVGQLDGIAALRVFTVLALAYSVVLCIRALHVEYRRIGPLKQLETRNVPGAPRIAAEPDKHSAVNVLTQLAALAPAALGAEAWIVAVCGIVATGALGYVTIPDALESLRMRQAKRATGFTQPLRQIQAFIDDYQPQVLVHLSGPENASYQINTWLEALEALDESVLIVIRDFGLFDKVAPTTIPIIALRDGGELMMLSLPSVKVAFYPSNTGNNIHLLRLPNIMSAFIGHGDSDKSASNNPFSRAYDELWVAGEAGADRYRHSKLGIHEDQYRFVGRPQVHPIRPTPLLGEEKIPTVLYAPTWEGVNLEQEYSSVRVLGPQIVSALLTAEPPVRVLYKPHPFTGQRDAKYRAAHARIVELIEAANVTSDIGHRVIRPGAGQPAINECFNSASALISDISSVISDFLASEKPYAVFNHTDSPAKDFAADYRSASAATIIDRDGSGIDEFIAVVTGQAPDTLATTRSRLATYLLGAPEQRTLAAFGESVRSFIARSEAERAPYRTGAKPAPSDVEFSD